MVNFLILMTDVGDIPAFSNYMLKYSEVTIHHIANLLSNDKTKNSALQLFCKFKIISKETITKNF